MADSSWDMVLESGLSKKTNTTDSGGAAVDPTTTTPVARFTAAIDDNLYRNTRLVDAVVLGCWESLIFSVRPRSLLRRMDRHERCITPTAAAATTTSTTATTTTTSTTTTSTTATTTATATTTRTTFPILGLHGRF